MSQRAPAERAPTAARPAPPAPSEPPELLRLDHRRWSEEWSALAGWLEQLDHALRPQPNLAPPLTPTTRPTAVAPSRWEVVVRPITRFSLVRTIGEELRGLERVEDAQLSGVEAGAARFHLAWVGAGSPAGAVTRGLAHLGGRRIAAGRGRIEIEIEIQAPKPRSPEAAGTEPPIPTRRALAG